MRAMVFAAGLGNRLRPMTDNLPKALVPVGGRPLIEYPLLLLRHYGIREIIINLHHFGEKIEAHLGDGEKLGLKIVYSKEKVLLETGGGLYRARHFLEGETFVLINSDVIIDLPLEEVILAHRKSRAQATLVLRPDPEADRYGSIETSRDGRIRRFLQHWAPSDGELGPLSKFMFTGVQILEPKIFDYLEPDAAQSPGIFSTTKVTYPKMLTEGEALYGYPFHGYWQDLGTVERIREAEEKLKHGEARLHYLD